MKEKREEINSVISISVKVKTWRFLNVRKAIKDDAEFFIVFGDTSRRTRYTNIGNSHI